MKKGEANNSKYVYNLIFPIGCRQLQIFGYTFQRTSDYVERVQSLQHLISVSREFKQPIKTGTHAITAVVDIPSTEKKPVIDWQNKSATALDDILLLFSIFTLRDVFAVNTPVHDGEGAITADPREYFFGLRTAIQYEAAKGEYGEKYNIGFQKGIEGVCSRMRAPEWQRTYGKGRFLPLFRAACKRQILETSFTTCWAIWEILFTLHNQAWLSEEQILRLPAAEKISFVLTRYEIKKSLDATDRKGIKCFVKIRNALVHEGRFLDDEARNDATLFVRVTAIIVAQILGLTASDVLGSRTDLTTRLRGQEVVPTRKK